MNIRKTRLAPSPTGALHLGNARTFLANWLLARQKGWWILLRIEDLDGPRIKTGADRLLIEDLRFLGLDWDEGPIYQSSRTAEYQAAIDSLMARGLAYPCVCSRREVELAASAPHAEDGASIYPGTCRGKFDSIEAAEKASGRKPAIRFAAPDREVQFNDSFAGPQSINVARQLGDFVIAKSDGTPAYQLAVVVDDLAAGITDIVRGDDLMESTFRQILIYDSLRLSPAPGNPGEGRGGGSSPPPKTTAPPDSETLLPDFIHLPLVVGEDGRRLAKRHGDTRIETYRRQGVPRSRILSLIAKWCGIPDWENPVDDPRHLLPRFELTRIPHAPIIFTSADDAWLRQTG